MFYELFVHIMTYSMYYINYLHSLAMEASRVFVTVRLVLLATT